MSKILCCLCGISITPNDAAMCIECIRSQFDITDVVQRSLEIVQCKKCERWNTGRDQWTHHEMESGTLLAACLRKINGLGQTRIKDAKWIWTEAHSKRMKIQVEIERDVLDGKIALRQNTIIEFVIKNKQCLPCIRESTDHTWGALIQLRQKVGHARSLYALEAGLIKSGLHSLIINVQQSREGLDMYFKGRNHAEKVLEFISSRIPTKAKSSQKLVSKDMQSNSSRCELTTYAEIAPLCKGDLIVTDKDVSGGLELMIITKLSNSIHLINPVTMRKVCVPGARYFMRPTPPVLTMHHLVTFVVLDISPVHHPERDISTSTNTTTGNSATPAITNTSAAAAGSGKEADQWFQLAEAEVCRESDLGENDVTYRVLTHLGRVLQVGDLVLGYDLSHTTMDCRAESILERLPYDRPDVMLVRKSYAQVKKKKSNKKVSSGGGGSGGRRRRGKQAKQTTTEAEAEAEVEGEEGSGGGGGGSSRAGAGGVGDGFMTGGLLMVDGDNDEDDEARAEYDAQLLDEEGLGEELGRLGMGQEALRAEQEELLRLRDISLELLAKEDEEEGEEGGEEEGVVDEVEQEVVASSGDSAAAVDLSK